MKNNLKNIVAPLLYQMNAMVWGLILPRLYLQEYGDVANTKNALIGYDPDCVVPNEEWYKYASTVTWAQLNARPAGEAAAAGA